MTAGEDQPQPIVADHPRARSLKLLVELTYRAVNRGDALRGGGSWPSTPWTDIRYWVITLSFAWGRPVRPLTCLQTAPAEIDTSGDMPRGNPPSSGLAQFRTSAAEEGTACRVFCETGRPPGKSRRTAKVLHICER